MSSLALSPLGDEALDHPDTDPQLVARMVRDIARSNRWLGGRHALRYGLGQVLTARERGSQLTLFDVGTGAADLPLAAVAWGRSHQFPIVPIGLERIRAAARVACDESGVPTLLGCASALPLRDQSVDVVLVSQLAHHLEHASIVHLFRECTRIARVGVIISDLRRAPLAGAAFSVAGRLLGLHPVTIADGVTSVARGFAGEELERLCEQAGASHAVVRRRPIARVVATWRTRP